MKMYKFLTVAAIGLLLATGGCDKSKPELEKTQAELMTVKADLAKAQADLAGAQKAQTDLADVQKERDSLKSDLEKAKTDLTAATTARDQMQQQIDTLTKEKADAVAKAQTESKTTIDSLQAEIAKLKALVEQLQSQLKGATGGAATSETIM